MDNSEWVIENIPGAARVVELFGCWPSFHDDEVTDIHFNRNGRSWIRINACQRELLEGEQRFSCTLDANVTFEFEDMSHVELFGFNHQNSIMLLTVRRHDEGIEFDIDSSYGLSCVIVAKQISVSVEMRDPDDKT